VTDLVQLAYDEHVALLTLNRPGRRNALTIEMCDEITRAVHQVDARHELRVAILSGAGEVFCAGADLSAVSGPHGTDFVAPFERMLEGVARCRVPVIAAINGAALGGGLQLASACDFRIAASNATLGIPSSRLGVVVNFENVRRLVLLVGFSVAKEILMAGRTFSGTEALGVGLINECVEDVDEASERWARDIAVLAPLSVQGAKRSFEVLSDHTANARRAAPDDVAALDALLRAAYESADLKEGLAALREKRPSNFRGR
jgi:enoyl-CoA hydratase